MAEELLHGSDVVTVLQQVCREGVPEPGGLSDHTGSERSLQILSNRGRCHRPAGARSAEAEGMIRLPWEAAAESAESCAAPSPGSSEVQRNLPQEPASSLRPGWHVRISCRRDGERQARDQPLSLRAGTHQGAVGVDGGETTGFQAAGRFRTTGVRAPASFPVSRSSGCGREARPRKSRRRPGSRGGRRGGARRPGPAACG